VLLYIIAATEHGPCKVGYTNNIAKRLYAIQIGNHLKLKVWSTWDIDDVQQAERLMHHKLGRSYIRGEWFDVSVAEAETACASIGMVKATSTYDYTRKPKPGDTRLSWLV